MELKLTKKQYRRLLDMVYIGNWVLNSTRGGDRFTDYDEVESLLFGQAAAQGMPSLAAQGKKEMVPSRAFIEGGIHDAILDYENTMFFEILAEELARRDMEEEEIDPESYEELANRIDAYILEFEQHGMDNILFEEL